MGREVVLQTALILHHLNKVSVFTILIITSSDGLNPHVLTDFSLLLYSRYELHSKGLPKKPNKSGRYLNSNVVQELETSCFGVTFQETLWVFLYNAI